MITLQGRSSSWLVAFSTLLLYATCAHAGSIKKSDTTQTANFYKNFELSVSGGVNFYSTTNTSLVISTVETDSNEINNTATDGAWKLGVGYYLFEKKLQNRKYFNHLLFEMNVYQTFTAISGVHLDTV